MTNWAKKAQILNPWVAEGKKAIQIETPVDMTPEKIQEIKKKQRSEADATTRLYAYATNLSNQKISSIGDMKQSCLMMINSDTHGMFHLGRGVINDAITLGSYLKEKNDGFWAFFHLNPTKQQFIDELKLFLEKTSEQLVIFYTGHGDIDFDQETGYHRYLIFTKKIDDENFINENLYDYELSEILKSYKGKKIPKTLFLTDACFMENPCLIPDNPKKKEEFPENFVSISSSDGYHGSGQGIVEEQYQGLFSALFWKALTEHPTYSFLQIQQYLNPKIHQQNQKCSLHYTSPELVEKPFFSPQK